MPLWSTVIDTSPGPNSLHGNQQNCIEKKFILPMLLAFLSSLKACFLFPAYLEKLSPEINKSIFVFVFHFPSPAKDFVLNSDLRCLLAFMCIPTPLTKSFQEKN